MNATTDTSTSTTVPHPSWCRSAPDDLALPHVDDRTSPHHGDRLAPAETGNEHLGRRYVLDVGECLSGSVSVQVRQMYEPDQPHDYQPYAATVALTTTDEDVIGMTGSVFLTPSDVDRLVVLLRRAKRDLELGEPRTA